MSAAYSTTARPPWARFIWRDHRNLYVELPSIEGQPAYVMTFPLSEGGLGKALNLLHDAYVEHKAPPLDYTRQPQVKRVSIDTPNETRARVQAILRKNGLLPQKPGSSD